MSCHLFSVVIFFVTLLIACNSSRIETRIRNTPYSRYDSKSAFTDAFQTTGPDLDLECNVRMLAYEFALNVQSYRGPTQPLTYAALDIDEYCSNSNNEKYIKYKQELLLPPINQQMAIDFNEEIFTVYIDASTGNDNTNGTIHEPFSSLQRALQSTRALQSNTKQKQIIIRKGILFLNETINLSPFTFDNNLLIRSYPNETAWISGGVQLKQSSLLWNRFNDGNSTHNIWMTKINIHQQLYNSSIYSLFTEDPHSRLMRARWPNGNLEVFYDSKMFISAENTLRWWLAENGSIPKQIFKNLSCAANNDEPCLNKSTQWQYNLYTAGIGGACSIWNTSNFWCGKYVSGGWAFEDANIYKYGMRQLPIGMTFNLSTLKRITHWKSNINEEGLVFILHDQGWCMTMNRISSDYNLDNGEIPFGFGGFQGANVNRLSATNAINNQPIMTGSYYFDGIFDELDMVGEWYFNSTSGYLYYWPNAKLGQPPDMNNTGNFVIGNLSTIIEFSDGLRNVTIDGISFRDTRYTYMDEWGVPSGGGWSLYRGGALYLENTSFVTVQNCYFTRIDNNAIMISGYNRFAHIKRNEFTLLGMNAIAGWGYTNEWDGTNGEQPRYTHILQNYIHEIGLYQLQSSGWFQAKTCQSVIQQNIIFNVPRAAINFNDAFGGGNDCSQNLLFNTCTESGDHGPINSWNRMPFLTNVSSGVSSYDPAYTNVHGNFIIANYGASQGFDTDDGSAWFNIYNNLNWNALGYKNDYGGYNVRYYNNMNVLWGRRVSTQSCWGIQGTIYDGPSNTLFGNKCIVYSADGVLSRIWQPSSLKGSALVLANNSYFSVFGNVTFMMEESNGQWLVYNISEMQNELGFEIGSTSELIPSNEQILQWIKETLQM